MKGLPMNTDDYIRLQMITDDDYKWLQKITFEKILKEQNNSDEEFRWIQTIFTDENSLEYAAIGLQLANIGQWLQWGGQWPIWQFYCLLLTHL